MPVNLSDLCCINSECPEVGKRGVGNLGFVRWIGKWKDIRFVHCRTCDSDFSERKGTPYFRATLPRDELDSIVQHLMEGDGIRKTGRLTGHKPDTVSRILKKAGLHTKAFHDEKAQHLNVPELQLDEKWSFVGKKAGPSHAARAGGGSPGG